MYRVALFVLLFTSSCFSQQCGETVVLQPGQSITLQSEDANGCTINVQPSTADAGLTVICPTAQLCWIPFICNIFNFNSLKFNNDFIDGSNVQAKYDSLTISYSYQQSSFLAGNGFTCSVSYASSPSTPFTCECGTKPSSGRIVAGNTAVPNEHPWTSRLTIRFGNYISRCGGTIISKYYILTAAHCVIGKVATNIVVNVGEHNALNNREPYDRAVRASKIIVHPSYNTNNLYNDIALIRLSQPLTFNNGVQPACLPKTSLTYAGSTGTVSGWGAIAFKGKLSQILLDIDVPIISNLDCLRELGRGYSIPPSMICTFDSNSHKDPCSGDSGGPLTVVDSGRTFVAGAVSWGVGCGTKPGVYTRVSSYIDWIQQNTDETLCIPNQ